MGYLYFQRGMAADSMQAYSQACSLRPNYAPVRMGLASALQQAGRLQEAAQQLQFAVQLDPANAQAAQMLAGLQARLPAVAVARSPLGPQPTQAFPAMPGYSAGRYGGTGQPHGQAAYQPASFGADTEGWSPANIPRVLFQPVAFFQDQAAVRAFMQPLIYYTLLVLPSGILSMARAASQSGSAVSGIFAMGGFIWIAIGYSIGVCFYLAAVGFFHLFCMMFSGKGGYEGTLRSSVYAATPFMVLGTLGQAMEMASPPLETLSSLMALFGLVWSFVLVVIGYREIHGLSTGAAFGAALIPVLIGILAIVALGAVVIAGLQNMRDVGPAGGFPAGASGIPGGFPSGNPQGAPRGFPGGFSGAQ